MAGNLVPSGPTLAVFASDRGPGDAERASIMSQAGSYLARRGARLVCLAEDDVIAVPLITSARAAGGDVIIIADDETRVPNALLEIALERISDPEARLARLVALADGLVGLPGSLASAASLYAAWIAAGAGNGRKPVVLLNRNRAFEVMRGYVADVVSHSVHKHDRIVQFTDQIEDLWNRITWMVNEVR